MKISNTIFCALSALVLTVASIPAIAEDYRIGVVNVLRVLEAAPQAERARKLLEREFATRDRELVAAQKIIKNLEDRLAKDGAIMSESERSRTERDIVTRKREQKRDQEEFREDVNFRRNEEFGKIQREIVVAIQKVAKEDAYDLIVGEGVIFASDRVDLTPRVIERLTNDYKAATGP